MILARQYNITGSVSKKLHQLEIYAWDNNDMKDISKPFERIFLVNKSKK